MSKTSGGAERSYRGVSQEQRIKARREAFMKAGMQLFGTQGYRATTVRDLCSEAKLTDRYFYESFEGTEELLCAVYVSIMDDLEQRLNQLYQDHDQVHHHAGRKFLATFFEAMQDPLVAKIVLVEVLGVSQRVDNLYQQNNLRFCNFLLSAINRTYGGFKPVASELYMCMGILGAINQIAVYWTLSQYRDPVNVLIDTGLALIEGCAKVPGAALHDQQGGKTD